jgi:hypothetical protein
MTNFETTLLILERRLNNRLRSEYSKIWVQGNNRPNATTLIFTIFDSSKYSMEFITIRNFRNFKPDGNTEEESILLNRQIDSFRTLLEKYTIYE